MKSTKIYSLSAFAAGMFFSAACSSDTSNSPLMTGSVGDKDFESLQVVYSLDGDQLSTVYQEIDPSADGTFSFSLDLPEKTLDVAIYVDNDIFGARLEEGKTVHVDIVRDGDAREIRFSGDNTDASNVYNAYVKAYDIMKYFSIDPSMQKTYEEYRELLDSEHDALKSRIESLENRKLRKYYTSLSEGMYNWSKVRIMLDKAYDEDMEVSDIPGYNEIIEGIDPNDIISVRTNLIYTWLDARCKQSGESENPVESSIAAMNIADAEVTDERCRKALMSYIPYIFQMSGPSKADIDRFMAEFSEFAKENPQLIESTKRQLVPKPVIAQGSELPYDPVLTKPDGSKVRLSDLRGKFTYIDIWATWCGPCCMEIPHLEKLADHFADNGNVQFLSISTDTDKDAWLKKLEQDKPAWPQYILEGEENDNFMKAMGITGIPRFIMLDKEGRIYEADAIRPSNEKIIETIESLL